MPSQLLLWKLAKYFINLYINANCQKWPKYSWKRNRWRRRQRQRKMRRRIIWGYCSSRNQDWFKTRITKTFWHLYRYRRLDQKNKIWGHQQVHAYVRTWCLTMVSLQISRESWLFWRMWWCIWFSTHIKIKLNSFIICF